MDIERVKGELQSLEELFQSGFVHDIEYEERKARLTEQLSALGGDVGECIF